MNYVDIVCFTSKLCNLRCRYCYELPMLGDKTRMRLDQVERMFENFNDYFHKLDHPINIDFVWHGGEPLLIPPEYYRQMFAIQSRVFADSIHKVWNRVQSNFTVMDEDRIELLRHDFDSAGISLDLFTDLRVDLGGACAEPRALANLERVRAAGVHVGGITVLTRLNMNHIPEIYNFYRERGMPFRILPLEEGLYAPGQDFEIKPREILEAMCTLADVWLADSDLLKVEPLDTFFSLLLFAQKHPEHRAGIYDKAARPSVILVDTNGDIYSYADRFEPGRSAGNVFEMSFGKIIQSTGHTASAQDSQARMQATCTRCSYFGRACPGDPVAERWQGFTEREEDGSMSCVVTQGLFRHLERRIESGAVAGGRFMRASHVGRHWKAA